MTVYCLLWLGFFQVSAPQADQLSQLIEELRAGNPALKAARARVDAARAEAEATGALPDPTASLAVFAQEVETRVGPQKQKLALEQQLPWQGKRALARSRAVQLADSRAVALEAVALQLTAELKQHYARHYLIGRTLTIHEEHLALLQSLEEVVAEKYKTSQANYGDLIRIQVEIDKQEDQVAAWRERGRPVIAAINSLIARDSSQPLPYPAGLPEIALPATDISPEHPGLKTLSMRADAERTAVKLAGLARYPDFKLGVEWINTGSAVMPGVIGSGDDPLILKVGVNLPVNRRVYKARKTAAAYRATAYQQQRRHEKVALEASLVEARFQFDDAQRKIALYRDRILPKAEEALNVSLASFQAGKADYLDLIDAEKALLEFQLALDEARADRFASAARIEALQGNDGGNP
ncbi:MAG: TolC family protein [Acidobacteriota bacterium]|nr:TolC family protein [Acidobacteriota bacterium]